ncbi:haloacid dehalogenase-like hydrolase [Fragilariopsis cylindrus CCMP1102]|uniref:Haloacid dehalogenase-like hydrolase n=1 Tax=Fragilariopsis cylindrus CCMP1102 TaxID=635003 RepID=A0A1E7EJZ7_9STRA|nr:haloacid dehalogenase-like hydrolase [Fragilariopsis cylindrus CCMP1102]|eukprot:OEU06197.1 haloacid dehalogenase-like hydrolase [Fragilariopsis cylindrus CCMP1102]
MVQTKRSVWCYYGLLIFIAYERQLAVVALSSRKAIRTGPGLLLVSTSSSSSSSSSKQSSLLTLYNNNGADDNDNADDNGYDSGINDFLSEILKSNKLSEILKSNSIDDVISSSAAGVGIGTGGTGTGSSTVESNNTSQPQSPPGGITKSDLYGDDELANLLQMHQQLTSEMTFKSKMSSNPNPVALHDFVLQAIGEIDIDSESDSNSNSDSDSVDEQQQPAWLSKSVKEKIMKCNIKAIASDIDGTIIGSDQKIHPKTEQAILRAQSLSVQSNSTLKYVFPATGKSRWGAMNSLGPELSFLGDGPGVYCQGLYCVVNGTDVIFEKKLNPSAVESAEQLVAEFDVAIVAYDGDDFYTTDSSKIEVIELHEKYGEPKSQEIPTIVGHIPGVHKILLLDNNNDGEMLNKVVRPRLEKLAKENGCTVTQAIPTMLELLPFGCSKALGVQKVCEYLNIDPGTELLAMGDAENDLEMLQDAAIGVAVNNAVEMCKDAADVVMPLTSTEGGAGLALEVILGI